MSLCKLREKTVQFINPMHLEQNTLDGTRKEMGTMEELLNSSNKGLPFCVAAVSGSQNITYCDFSQVKVRLKRLFWPAKENR